MNLAEQYAKMYEEFAAQNLESFKDEVKNRARDAAMSGRRSFSMVDKYNYVPQITKCNWLISSGFGYKYNDARDQRDSNTFTITF